MKKQLKNKLVLDRETVAVLQSDALGAVHGGNAVGCISCTSQPTSGISRETTQRLLGCVSRVSQVSQISQISRQVSWGGGEK